MESNVWHLWCSSDLHIGSGSFAWPHSLTHGKVHRHKEQNRAECFTNTQIHAFSGTSRDRKRWMDWGREHSNITRLYREGSSEEKMC